MLLPGKAAAPCPANVGVWVLVATILGSSMGFIDGSVVNVALPAIQRQLGATAVDAQWIVESYALFLAALILVGGSLGDHLGRRMQGTLFDNQRALAREDLIGYAGEIGWTPSGSRGSWAGLPAPGGSAATSKRRSGWSSRAPRRSS